MAAYYNEFDKDAAQTLRELIKDGLIADGDVDDRSICDVKADELKGYTQCHFFAGCGVWSAALRLAGWPDTRPVWTGSCPCQDYSVAGKGEGASGDRDLWPVFASLIRECGPTVVFGEQVEAAIGFGWLDRLRTDLEAEAYALGGVVLGAHSAGADHIRQRLYWVADVRDSGLQGSERGGAARKKGRPSGYTCKRDSTCGLADMQREGLQGHSRHGDDGHEPGRDGTKQTGPIAKGCAFDLWQDSRWHHCRDGKARRIPTEPRLFPLAPVRDHKGYRVAALRQAGNAITIGTAAMFIEAFKQTIADKG